MNKEIKKKWEGIKLHPETIRCLKEMEINWKPIRDKKGKLVALKKEDAKGGGE